MSTALIIVMVVAVILVAVLALALTRQTAGTGAGGLQRRFGPEYERAVAGHDGDEKAAQKELSERLRRHGKLRARPLSAAEREQYEIRWARIQGQFVDAPRAAVAEADHLLTRLVHDRGFPSETHDEQVAALSVHHPQVVDGYRRTHLLARQDGARGADGHEVTTEELRDGLLRGRAFFRELLAEDRPGAGADGRAAGFGRTVRQRLSRGHDRPAASTKGGA